MNSRRLWILLLLIVASGGYLSYRNQDRQIIGRQVDQLLENIEYQKISLRKESDIRKSISEVVAPEIELLGSPPIPNLQFSTEGFIEQILQFHQWITRCQIKEKERTISIQADQAEVQIIVDVEVAAGKNHKRAESWDIILRLKKLEKWRIDQIKAFPAR